MISAWFIEYKDADMSYIKSYHNHKYGYISFLRSKKIVKIFKIYSKIDISESKSATSLLWLMIKIMPLAAQVFDIKRIIFTIATWFVTMVLQIYWIDPSMKKDQLVQSVKNGIQFMKVYVQPIKLLFQFHEKILQRNSTHSL